MIELAKGGLVVPDHGMEPVRFGADMVVFDFCMLKADDVTTNDFFAYKITVVGDAEKPTLPATGDRENILLWLAALAVSSVCLAALIRRSKEA